jgi:hypothetical protein
MKGTILDTELKRDNRRGNRTVRPQSSGLSRQRNVRPAYQL